MKRVLLVAFAITIVLCASAQKEKTTIPVSSSTKSPIYTYKIVRAPDSTFVYDIYTDGRLLIHQTSIPAISGNKGFKRKEQAQKVAKLAIKKLKAGEMPPTISIDELKQLKALN